MIFFYTYFINNIKHVFFMVYFILKLTANRQKESENLPKIRSLFT